MFGKKKDSDQDGPGIPEAAKDNDDLDIPAPKTAPPRPLSAPARPQSGSPSLDMPKRHVSAPPPRPRSETSPTTPPPPAPQQVASVVAPAPAAMGAESNKLVVGREIRLKGEVTSCDVLVVEGSVELSLTDARRIQVASSGLFSGTVEVDEADIAGQFDGELTVRDRLVVRSGGKVEGRIRYGNIVIESGGRITGELQALAGETKRPPTAPSFTGLGPERPAGPGNGGLELHSAEPETPTGAEERQGS